MLDKQEICVKVWASVNKMKGSKMPNMTVAMFRNTLNLLMDCEEFLKENQFHFDELPKEEQIAAIRVIYLSKHIAEHYGQSVKSEDVQEPVAVVQEQIVRVGNGRWRKRLYFAPLNNGKIEMPAGLKLGDKLYKSPRVSTVTSEDVRLACNPMTDEE